MTTGTPFDNVITAPEDLRQHYRQAADFVRSKIVTEIDLVAREFLSRSPFCLVATADADGRCDVSPRGGPPGFVRVLDEHRVVVPDLNGNNLLDSLTNIVTNAHAGLLCVVPGNDETLRIEGDAYITTDPAILSLWDGELRTPKAAIGIAVRTAYVHCAKSFRRGGVWNYERWDRDAPDVAAFLVGRIGDDLNMTEDDLRKVGEEIYARQLAEDVPER